MKQYHKPYKKKVASGSGGKRLKFRDKKLAHIGSEFTATKVSANDLRITRRKRGGHRKIRLKKAAFASVVTKDKKTVKTKILRVLESHNTEYVRSNIITKGAVIETELGKVRVTNRVGQDGIVNGIQL